MEEAEQAKTIAGLGEPIPGMPGWTERVSARWKVPPKPKPALPPTLSLSPTNESWESTSLRGRVDAATKKLLTNDMRWVPDSALADLAAGETYKFAGPNGYIKPRYRYCQALEELRLLAANAGQRVALEVWIEKWVGELSSSFAISGTEAATDIGVYGRAREAQAAQYGKALIDATDIVQTKREQSVMNDAVIETSRMFVIRTQERR
jgi:hypothetical protein